VLGLQVTAHSQRGAKREVNQDTVGIQSWRNVNEFKDGTTVKIPPARLPSLVILADGIGGHENGGAASRTAVDTICEIFESAPDDFQISSAVIEAHMALKLSAQGSHRPMGTTILGLVIGISRVSIFNVGDSKGYRLRDTKISQLTIEDRSNSGRGNALTQCLGGGSRNPKAHQVEFGYQTGDKFVLLSDGVTDCVSDEQILNSISRAGSESASDLCERALSLGSGDDLSAIVIDCSE
jgi:serine/threonine protein phosphatase PrpC